MLKKASESIFNWAAGVVLDPIGAREKVVQR